MSERVDRSKTLLEAFPRVPLARSHDPREDLSAGVPDDVPPRLGEGSARIDAARPTRGVTVLRQAAGPPLALVAVVRPSRSGALPDPVEIKRSAHAAIVSAATHLDGVACISRAAWPDTYVVSLDEGRPFAVRISARRLDHDLGTHTVDHPVEDDLVPITDPADPAATYDVAVRGLYVIHLSDALDPADVEGAFGHEFAMLITRHRLGLLAARSPAALRAPPPRLHGTLIAPLSLPHGDPGATERRHLLKPEPRARESIRALSLGPLTPICGSTGCTICGRHALSRPA
jgi:hypothetical protein